MTAALDMVEDFVKAAFQENPSYSFGDWRIMYDHSVMVKELALRIGQSQECDEELLGIAALLHDVGKTYKTDAETLRMRHAELGLEVAKQLIAKLSLTQSQSSALGAFLKADMESIEARIIKDADIIAFFSDERLQKAFKVWADNNNLPNELQRKADKITMLKLDASKTIAEPAYLAMIKRWDLENNA